MTIRYAAARPAARPATLSPAALGRLTMGAANDNGDVAVRDLVLRHALKHFAMHGLGAAQDAAQRAAEAHRRGTSADYQHWISICKALDPRRAHGLSASLRRR